MTNGSAASGNVDQFLVAPRSAGASGALADFENALRSFPDANVLTRAGSANQPRLVVALGPDSLQQLKSRFGDSLIIERNAPLQLP